MPNVAYVVFDRIAAPKGAAVHIGAFARALGRGFGPVALVGIADGEQRGGAAFSPEDNVRVVELPAQGANLIDRVNDFRTHLARWWDRRTVDVLHFRSIFEGYPLALHKHRVCRHLVFEVNGLPSIELKYHHPAVAEDRELLHKLRAQEQVCIEAADLLVTVSEVTAAHLRQRGADPRRIRVVANGVEPELFTCVPPRLVREPLTSGRELRLLYNGTLAAWQGVYRAIEALGLLLVDRPARLLLLGPGSLRRRHEIARFCERLGVAAHVEVLEPGPQQLVVQTLHACDVALAPLLRNDRNVVQGCCPLKVLEAMACGVPLVASDLPVVDCLARHEREALLVKPGSARELCSAIVRLAQEPQLAARLAAAARQRIEQQFTWRRAGDELLEAYAGLTGTPLMAAPDVAR